MPVYLSIFFPYWKEDVKKRRTFNSREKEVCELSEEDAKDALFKLARWALRFSPLVSAGSHLQTSSKVTSDYASDFGLLLDLTGTHRMYGSWERCIGRISQKLQTSGLRHKMALSHSSAASWGIARFYPTPLEEMPWKDVSRVCQSLPLAALRISSKQVELLHSLGIENISALRKLTRKEIATRIGLDCLDRLDSFLGFRQESHQFISEEKPLLHSKDYSIPLYTKHLIVQESEGLLELLIKELKAKELTSPQLTLCYEGRNQADRRVFCLKRNFTVSEQLFSKTSLCSLLSSLIEPLKIPGSVERITVVCNASSRIMKEQLKIEKNRKEYDNQQKALNNLVGSLALTLGSNRTLRAERRAEYAPESAVVFQALEHNYERQLVNNKPSQTIQAIPLDTPPHIFSAPEPIRVLALLPDRAPSEIFWRTRRYHILRGCGPECITLPWWEEATSSQTITQREYFKILDETGRWLWVFRSSDVCGSLKSNQAKVSQAHQIDIADSTPHNPSENYLKNYQELSSPQNQWFIHGAWG